MRSPTQFELLDVVLRLTGPVLAVGETNEDVRRLENLKELTDLAAQILDKISAASGTANRQEASMKAIGKHARDFLRGIRYAE